MNQNTPRAITRRQILRGGAGLAGLAVAGGMLSACGDDEPKSSGGSASASKGPIVMVNYPGWMGATEVSDFKKQTGITVKESTGLTDGGSASQAAQLARNKGDYDMALSGNVLGRTLEQADMIQQVDFANIPNIEGVDATFRDQFTWGIPVEYGKLGIAYRKDLLPKPPESWEEMFAMAPQISGKFTFPDYDVDVLSMAILALGYDINTADPDEIEAARDLLIETKPDLKAFLATDASKPLIEGSVVLAALHDYDMPSAMKANDKIGWIAPSEGLPSYIDGWLALAGTKQTSAIEKFMNFHLEPEVYADFINTTGAAFLLPAAEPHIDKAILQNPAMRLDDSVTMQWQTFIDADGVKVRNTAWNEIKAA
ncbi:MAG: spermidine/putrescine ABC transporter substrate-binding protein [Nocardioidaceae bacterium]